MNRPIIRNLIAVIVGLAAAFLVISVIEWLNGWLHKIPADWDLADREGMARWIKALPLSAFILLLIGYFAGTLTGASIGGLLSAAQPARIAFIVTAILLIFGAVNLMQVPHPIWFMIGTMAAYLLAGLLGARLGSLLWARRQILRNRP